MQNIGLNSALMREINPDAAQWNSTLKTNAILADIYDLLAVINANMISLGTHKTAKKPKPYPRPGADRASKDEKHFGSDPLPVNELHKWIEEKRAEYARNSTGHNTGHASP